MRELCTVVVVLLVYLVAYAGFFAFATPFHPPHPLSEYDDGGEFWAFLTLVAAQGWSVACGDARNRKVSFRSFLGGLCCFALLAAEVEGKHPLRTCLASFCWVGAWLLGELLRRRRLPAGGQELQWARDAGDGVRRLGSQSQR